MVVKKPTDAKGKRPAPPAGTKGPKDPKGQRKGIVPLTAAEKLKIAKNPDKVFRPRGT